MDFEIAIHQERTRRRNLPSPMHYWWERGDAEPPSKEYWCAYCVGYYGVPHDNSHDSEWCKNRFSKNHNCACIDCYVYRQILENHGADSL